MATKTALVTGATGQDGTLLSEHLLTLGYRVVGVVRRGGSSIINDVERVEADLSDRAVVRALLDRVSPDEVYHLAAFHHSSQDASVVAQFAFREGVLSTGFSATQALALGILEAGARTSLVFAASSQMYTADVWTEVVTESTPRRPSTFYGHVKSWSMELLAQLRADLGLRASTAILFNHESPLRPPQFVSRKITRAAAAAKLGYPVALEVLNTRARVDWSSARDVVVALQRMADTPDDYVVASGRLHAVEDLLEIAFRHVGLDWHDHATVRATREENALAGDARKLEGALGWTRAWTFEGMVQDMVEHDLASMRLECFDCTSSVIPRQSRHRA
jgi:GDPmannose 4,6-dehydratase